MKKFNYRIVNRNSLGDLERQVRRLEKRDWMLVENESTPTIVQALDSIRLKRDMVCVSMKREITEEVAHE